MVIEAGLKLDVSPEGRLPVVRVTVPVKAASGVTVTVYCAIAPGVMFVDAGVTLRENSGVAEAGEETTKVL